MLTYFYVGSAFSFLKSYYSPRSPQFKSQKIYLAVIQKSLQLARYLNFLKVCLEAFLVARNASICNCSPNFGKSLYNGRLIQILRIGKMLTYFYVGSAFSFLKSYYSPRSPNFWKKFALWSTNTELSDRKNAHVLLCTLRFFFLNSYYSTHISNF